MDAPVRPAVAGTFTISSLGMTYTAGPDAPRVLDRLLERGDPLACDIETFGLGPDARRVKAVTFATRQHAVVLDPRNPYTHGAIRTALTTARRLIFHNSPYDVPNMHVYGLFSAFDVPAVCDRIVDTQIYARLAWPDTLVPKTLDACVERLLRIDTGEPITAAFKRLGLTKKDGYRTMDIDRPTYLMGAAVDAVMTARIELPIIDACRATLTQGHPFSTYGIVGDDVDRLIEREQQLNRSSLRRACRGFRVDFDFLDSYRRQFSQKRSIAEAELAAAGIRPGNSGDLITVLERDGAIPDGYPRTEKTGRPSTVAGHLEQLRHPAVTMYIEAKRIAKVEDDYLSKVVDLASPDGRIHATVNYLKATTGRMSIGDPPLQQFPEDARGIILADEGDSLVSIDWSQIEPVLIANVAGDLSVLRGYENATSDLYTDVASRAGITRDAAKVVLLAQLYGEGIAKLSRDLGVSEDDAKTLRDGIFAQMPRVNKLLWKLRDIGRDHRKIFTLSGRIVPIPMGKGFQGGPPSVATHKAINYHVQGGAYDLLAEAMLACVNAGLGDGIYLAMHDELLVSKDVADDVERIMRVPPARLCWLAKRTPVLRTDRKDLGERWAKA